EGDGLTLDALNGLIDATGLALEELRQLNAVSETSLLTNLRGLEGMLHDEQRVSGDALARRIGDAEVRLRRLEAERPRAERWPVETPWSFEYTAAHRSFVAAALDDPRIVELFAAGRPMTPRLSVRFD